MTVTAGQDGSAEVTTGPQADPAFASAAPLVWDSAAPPSGTPTGTVNGTVVVSPSGMPADSSITGPGAYAHLSAATQSVTGSTITVTAPGRVAVRPRRGVPGLRRSQLGRQAVQREGRGLTPDRFRHSRRHQRLG